MSKWRFGILVMSIICFAILPVDARKKSSYNAERSALQKEGRYLYYLTQKLAPSIVTIRRSDISTHTESVQADWEMNNNDDGYLGSGIIWSKDGEILTTHAVMKGNDVVDVILNDGQSTTATVVGADEKSDIAILKLDTKTPVTPCKHTQKDTVQIGQSILMINRTPANSITMRLRRASSIIGDRLIQLDHTSTIRDTSSAIVTTSGRCAGIVTTGTSPHIASAALAIPLHVITPIVADLTTHGRVMRGWIGAEFSVIPHTDGVEVSDVGANTPAAFSGLHRGNVITHFDGNPVQSANQLQDYIETSPLGATKPLTIRTNTSNNLTRTVQIQAEPDMNTKRIQSLSDTLGLHVSQLSQGVMVLAVASESPADQAGIQRGDVIGQIEQQVINHADDYQKVVESAVSGDKMIVLIQRNDHPIFSIIEIE